MTAWQRCERCEFVGWHQQPTSSYGTARHTVHLYIQARLHMYIHTYVCISPQGSAARSTATAGQRALSAVDWSSLSPIDGVDDEWPLLWCAARAQLARSGATMLSLLRVAARPWPVEAYARTPLRTQTAEEFAPSPLHPRSLPRRDAPDCQCRERPLVRLHALPRNHAQEGERGSS